MDTAKLGVATAKAMDDIEKLVAEGDIEDDAYMGAVVIVVGIDRKTSAKDQEDGMRSVGTATFVFSEPEELYVQLGLLEMAKSNFAPAQLEDD